MMPSYSSQTGVSFKENLRIKAESIPEDLSSASGSGMGVGMSEKEIDERVSPILLILELMLIVFGGRYLRLWKLK